jgi:hypothetical protein
LPSGGAIEALNCQTTTKFNKMQENNNLPLTPHLRQTAVVGSASDGFNSFDIHRHSSDEVEFRVKCKSCGMSAMDAENSCIECECEWFQNMFNDFDDDFE